MSFCAYLIVSLCRGVRYFSTTKQKLMLKKIGTHNGTFHCDEALACFMLHQTKEFKNAELVRSRDPAVLETLDILVDVGGVYDPSRHRYDHHQREFTETLDEHHKTKLSSAGLIYKHFGREIIVTLLETDTDTTEIIFQNVYKNLIESIDCIDNGIAITQDTPKYRITTDLSSRVKFLNPAWNEPNTDIEAQFKKAMELTGAEFLQKVNFCGKHWLPARQVVERAVRDRLKYSDTGEIFVLDQFCPWISHLFEIEEDLGIKGQLKYALFADQSGQWRIQSVPNEESGFENRASLPETWRGRRDEELSKITGVKDCVFAHQNGFIGGNKTFEGVLNMAIVALKILNNK